MTAQALKIKTGFTKTPNKILENLIESDLPKSEYKVALYILRETAGWHKPLCYKNISRIMERTGLPRTSVYRAIAGLIEKGIIQQTENHIGFAELPKSEPIPEPKIDPIAKPISPESRPVSPAPVPGIPEKMENPKNETDYIYLRKKEKNNKSVVFLPDLFPESSRKVIFDILMKNLSRGTAYLETACHYVLKMKGIRNIPAYLSCCLRCDYHLEWGKAEQERERDTKKKRIEAENEAIRTKAENERIIKAKEARQKDMDLQNEKIKNMSPPLLEAMKAAFILRMDRITAKRFRNKGWENFTVQSAFRAYIAERV